MEGAYEYEHVSAVKFKRCRFCLHEQDRKCLVKPGRASVKLNKKRAKCKKYKADETKLATALMKKEPVPVIRRPDWFWMSKEEISRIAAALMAAELQSTAKADPDHPVTGDLSRFLVED